MSSQDNIIALPMEIIYYFQTLLLSLRDRIERLDRRLIYSTINFDGGLVGLLGGKGVGKTTLMLQNLFADKSSLQNGSSLYLPLDHPALLKENLFDIIRHFRSIGGKRLFLDEVHKYEDWSTHVKAAHDYFPEIQIAFSGSSVLHLHDARGDLSRRAHLYHIPGFSFREFLVLRGLGDLKPLTCADIFSNHIEISRDITEKIKPLASFNSYLRFGVYPFHLNNQSAFFEQLREVVNHTIESDLVILRNIEPRYVVKLKKLLGLLASSVPYSPNMVELSGAIEVSRQVLSRYLEYLEESELILLLRQQGRGNEKLTKPEKIYLQNTNLMYALSSCEPNKGSLREVFILHHLRNAHYLVEASSDGDFVIGNKTTLEIGGKNKRSRQIKGVENSFLVVDDEEVGTNKKIPLWLFGFLW